MADGELKSTHIYFLVSLHPNCIYFTMCFSLVNYLHSATRWQCAIHTCCGSWFMFLHTISNLECVVHFSFLATRWRYTVHDFVLYTHSPMFISRKGVWVVLIGLE